MGYTLVALSIVALAVLVIATLGALFAPARRRR
jgi:hypothetical protein